MPHFTAHTITAPWHKQCFAKWLVVVSLLLTTITGVAQNNAFKINDEVYQLYVKSQTKRSQREGLELANQMYKRAEELGDRKGMTMALSTKLMHLSYKLNYTQEAFDKTMAKLKATAEKYGYWQYYYFGSNFKLSRYFDEHNYQGALKYASEMQHFATKQQNHYGIYNSYRQLAEVHRFMGEMGLAEKNYKQALEYGIKNCPDQDMGVSYADLCTCAELEYDYNKLLRYADEGIAISKTPMMRTTLKRYKALALFALGRYNSFKSLYDDLAKNYPNALSNYSSRLGVVLNSFNIVMTERDMKKVEQFTEDHHLDGSSWSRALYECYRYMGMYREAFECLNVKVRRHIQTSHSNKYEAVSSAETLFHGLIYSMEKEEEDLERVSLNLTNNKLKLQQAKLELEKATQSESIARLDAENSHLNYENKRFEATQLADSLNILKTQQEAHELETLIHNGIMASLVAATMVIMTIIIIFAGRIRTDSSRLHYANVQLLNNNAQLTEEYAKTQKANQSKADFIRNMTNDIHAPLNAIIDAAAILGSKDSHCTDEEKLELGNTINEKTAELLSLIDTTMENTKK